MSAAWAAARAANATDEDEDGEKDKFGARGAKKREVGKIESDSEKEEKAKFASRKSGTRIAEVEKRPVVARLKADEAEWKKRDVHTRHETATLEIGKAVAWHYAPSGKPGELQCGNQPVRQAGLEVLFIILAASMQHESAWRPRTRRLRLIHPNV